MFQLMLFTAKEFIQLGIHVVVAIVIMRITCAMPACLRTMAVPVSACIVMVIVVTTMSVMIAVA